MIHAHPIKAYHDNYIWCLSTATAREQVVVVDPGDAQPVRDVLAHDGRQLAAILVTHHHWDHIDGIDDLLSDHAVPVYGPASRLIPQITHPLQETDTITPIPGLQLTTVAVPGHTLDHLAYIGEGLLLAGDTLFSAGCGRLFEGSPEQMYHSLSRFALLPATTRLCCSHEYTLDNLAFAIHVEPDNPAIRQRIETVRHLRRQGLPSLPSDLRCERQTNPFLRCHVTTVMAAAERHAGRSLDNPVEVFAVLRAWKDGF